MIHKKAPSPKEKKQLRDILKFETSSKKNIVLDEWNTRTKELRLS